MKTYKQRYKIACDEMSILHYEFMKIKLDNYYYKQAIEHHQLFDPIEYKKIKLRLSTAIEGLDSIRVISDNTSKIIATEVLLQIDAIDDLGRKI